MLNIIPKPKKMTLMDGYIRTETISGKEKSAPIPDAFEAMGALGGVSVELIKADFPESEKYILKISENGISAEYSDEQGLFRAYTTLNQIIRGSEDGQLPCLEIEDKPSYANRGYMLDISRGKIPDLAYLKKLADILCDLKYNQLQLYMDSFVYEYRGFDEYWRDTQPLTKAEIQELDAYCRERFIELVPIQNSFGHMSAWTAKKEIAPLAVTGKNGKPSQTLNPLLPQTLEFLDKLYGGMLDAFSSGILNIGMDETAELGINETEEECAKKGVGRVYTEYLKKVCDLVCKKYNKKPMFFDDIVFKHPEELANIPKNATVMQWGYETEQQFDRNCRRLREQGLRFYVCPGTSMWGSITGRTNNALVNITSAAECGNYYGADGYLLTEWGDDGHPQFPANTYLPLVFGGYASWNSGSHNSEVAYGERRDMIKECKSYLDNVIFKSSGKASLADIVFRMGNYYLLEDRLSFNGTELTQCFMRRCEADEAQLAAFARVRDFMLSLRAELDGVDCSRDILDEVRLNCDMVIMQTALVRGEADSAECKRILAEYNRLWRRDNHEAGMDIFPELVRGWLK